MKLAAVKSWWLDQWANSFQSYRERKSIVLHDDGFEFVDPKGPTHIVTWTSVNRINAFKRDLFTIDLICFEFYQDTKVTEVTEQMDGFDRLEETLPCQFAGFDPEWRRRVVQPAFAPNFTELWKGNSRCADDQPTLH